MTDESPQDDVTAALTPRQAYLALVLYAGERAYMDWVPRWWWLRIKNTVDSIEVQLDKGWLSKYRT